MKSKISILLTHYREVQVTWSCIASILDSQYSSFNIVAIDNSLRSTDETTIKKNCFDQGVQFKVLEESSGPIEFDRSVYWYRSSSNTGYAGGMNLGAEIARSANPDFLLLLNNDTIVSPLFLSTFLEAVSEQANSKDFGFASCTILTHPEEKVWYSGGRINLVRGSGVHWTDQLKNDPLQETDFISGCCMLCRPEVYRNLSGMDESFFLYLEDVDLCLRAKKAGYKLYFAPQVELHHRVGSSTGGEESEIPVYYSNKNRIKLMHKHFGGLTLLRFYLFFIPSRMIKALIYIAKGQEHLAKAMMNGIKNELLPSHHGA